MAEVNPEITPQEALSEAVRVFNHREMVRGFSPVQHLMGHAPDETGRFVSSLTGRTCEMLLDNPNVGIQKSVELMKRAEQALSEWQARQRVNRAMNSRPQKMMEYRPGDLIYRPGDLVYFWRKQVKNPGVGKHGMFLGPARILAMETHKDEQGQPRPSRAIWCVRGRRLLKCSPEQLRPASPREELLDHLASEGEPSTPWTLPRVAAELGGNEYEDISEEIPSEPEWTAAQDPALTLPPSRRHSYKRPVEQPYQHRSSESQPQRSRTSTTADASYGEKTRSWLVDTDL